MNYSSKTRLKKGDTVKVLGGKDKGRTGKIIQADRARNTIVVEGVNLHYKFEKPKQNKPGQRISFAAPMPASKVMAVCPSCGKATRIGMSFLESGAKQRICKKCKSAI